MKDHASMQSAAVEEERTLSDRGLVPQLLMLARAFWASPERTRILLLGAGLVVVIGATAFRTSLWTPPFSTSAVPNRAASSALACCTLSTIRGDGDSGPIAALQPRIGCQPGVADSR
jgi:hypothetical protein